jgi:hypothetical protein
MGLANSPFGLIKILNQVLSRLLANNSVYLYMDDLTVAEPLFEDHILVLKTLFQTFRANDLVCNPAKCTFMEPETVFLGQKISCNGVTLDPSRTKIVKSLAPARNKKSAQRLVGLFQYFRRYVPSYSQRSYNLRALLSDKTPFQWTEKCSAELEDLKQAISCPPILQAPDPTKDYFIFTDASKQGVAFCLAQYHNNKAYPIAFGGHSLNSAQQNYSVGDLELLAVVSALRQYQHYLIDRKVTIVSDSVTVQFLHKLPLLSVRHRRMAAYLMQFNLTTRFLKGSQNYVADCLSRMFEDLTDEQKVEFQQQRDFDDYVFATKQHEQLMDSHLSSAKDTILPHENDGERQVLAYHFTIDEQKDSPTNFTNVSPTAVQTDTGVLDPTRVANDVLNRFERTLNDTGLSSTPVETHPTLISLSVDHPGMDPIETSDTVNGPSSFYSEATKNDNVLTTTATDMNIQMETDSHENQNAEEVAIDTLQPTVEITAKDYLDDDEFKQVNYRATIRSTELHC